MTTLVLCSSFEEERVDDDLVKLVFPSHGFDYIINLEAPRDHANKLYHTHARKIMGKEYRCIG